MFLGIKGNKCEKNKEQFQRRFNKPEMNNSIWKFVKKNQKNNLYQAKYRLDKPLQKSDWKNIFE